MVRKFSEVFQTSFFVALQEKLIFMREALDIHFTESNLDLIFSDFSLPQNEEV